MPLILGTNSIKDTAYDVANSCRFNDGSSDSLTKTSSTGSNTTSTLSVWIKRANLGAEMKILNFTGGGNNLNIEFKDDDQLSANAYDGSSQFSLKTNRKFRDISSWYNIIVAIDSTQSTSSNRIKIYVNGIQETSFATSNYPSEDDTLVMNNHLSSNPFIGQNGGNNHFFDGYMTEVCWIDGSQLDQTSFGEYDSDSPTIWKPIDVSGLTFGTNGFYLDFENASSLGADVSGNSNNFTVNNLTSIDQSTDTCTNNFATMNPLENYYNQSTFSEGNLQVAVGSSQYSYNLSTIGVSTGKWYCEMKCTSAGGNNTTDIAFGVSSTQPVSNAQVLGYHPNDLAYRGNGNKKINNSDTSYGDTFSTDDIIGIALNLDDNEVKFYKNGTVQNSGTAISITAPASTGLGNYFFGISYINTSNTATFQTNFGSPPHSISSGNSDANGHGNFEYSVPSGYFALCTKNLAEFG